VGVRGYVGDLGQLRLGDERGNGVFRRGLCGRLIDRGIWDGVYLLEEPLWVD
jgi:hypothetical protein